MGAEHSAPVDHADTVAHLFQLGKQVAGNEYRHALPVAQLLENIPQILDAGGIQSVGRLIQHKQGGTVQDRLGKTQPLAHTQRILGDLVVNPGLKPDQTDHLVKALLGNVAVHPGVLLQILPSGQVFIHLGVFNDTAHRFYRFFKIGHDVAPADPDLPLLHAQKPQHQLDGGGLTGAVRSEESENFTGVHIKIDIVKNQPGAKMLAQIPDGRDRCSVLCSFFHFFLLSVCSVQKARPGFCRKAGFSPLCKLYHTSGILSILIF